MDHVRITGTEASSVILSQKNGIFKSWKEIPKRACQNKLMPKGMV